MIQPQTILRVVDNSGGRTARCLKILKKGAQPRYGKIGDVIVVAIQQLRKKNRLTSKVQRGDVVRGVITQTRAPFKRATGLAYAFSQNGVVLIEKQGKPIATRVLGLTPKELKTPKFSKIISLSAGTI